MPACYLPPALCPAPNPLPAAVCPFLSTLYFVVRKLTFFSVLQMSEGTASLAGAGAGSDSSANADTLATEETPLLNGFGSRAGAGVDALPQPLTASRTKFHLFGTHFLQAFGDRMWAFAVNLPTILNLSPTTLKCSL
jgi:hypothetical protein